MNGRRDGAVEACTEVIGIGNVGSVRKGRCERWFCGGGGAVSGVGLAVVGAVAEAGLGRITRGILKRHLNPSPVYICLTHFPPCSYFYCRTAV